MNIKLASATIVTAAIVCVLTHAQTSAYCDDFTGCPMIATQAFGAMEDCIYNEANTPGLPLPGQSCCDLHCDPPALPIE